MGLLTETPECGVFQAAPNTTTYHDGDLQIVDNQAIKAIEEKIGSIFVKHEMNKKFGVIMIHRHFEMGDNEILVESVSGDESYSLATPWTVKNGSVYIFTYKVKLCFNLIYFSSLTGDEATAGTLEWNSVVFKDEKYVIPQTWSISPDGTLKAYEYLSSPEVLPNPPQEFVNELHLALREMQLESFLGIRRLGQLGKKFGSEISPGDMKGNVTKYTDLNLTDYQRSGKHFFPVMWAFNEDGGMRLVQDCSSSTTNGW